MALLVRHSDVCLRESVEVPNVKGGYLGAILVIKQGGIRETKKVLGKEACNPSTEALGINT